MATYEELRGSFNDSSIRNKVTMATVIAAYDLLQGTPTAADRAWASSTFSSPEAEGRKAFMAVLAANKDTALASIQSATDSAIQTQVDGIVPSLVQALAGA